MGWRRFDGPDGRFFRSVGRGFAFLSDTQFLESGKLLVKSDCGVILRSSLQPYDIGTKNAPHDMMHGVIHCDPQYNSCAGTQDLAALKKDSPAGNIH